jgi:uncharacterized membrane protein
MKVYLRRYFITGLLVIIPIWGTYLVLSALLRFLEGFLGNFLKDFGRFYFPGMGIVALFAFILLVGVLTTNFIGRKIMALWEETMKKVPLVRSVYSVFKNVVDTVSLHGEEHFRRVVLLEFPREGMYSIGFVTGVMRGEVQNLTEERIINVFVPTTPNPTTGYFLFVPESKLVPLSMSVEDGMKIVISGGLYVPTTIEGIKQSSGKEVQDTTVKVKG